jgi:hypothetical protein
MCLEVLGDRKSPAAEGDDVEICTRRARALKGRLVLG